MSFTAKPDGLASRPINFIGFSRFFRRPPRNLSMNRAFLRPPTSLCVFPTLRRSAERKIRGKYSESSGETDYPVGHSLVFLHRLRRISKAGNLRANFHANYSRRNFPGFRPAGLLILISIRDTSKYPSFVFYEIQRPRSSRPSRSVTHSATIFTRYLTLAMD